MSHGGKRKGAGRPTSRGERKVTLSVRVTPTVKAFLESCDESASEQVEQITRRTAAFRAWSADSSGEK